MILFVTSELAPFSRASGLSDIARSLPKTLQRLGNQVSIVTPFYRFINDSQLKCVKETMRVELTEDHVEECSVWKTEHEGVPVYFIRHDTLLSKDEITGYENDVLRFELFAKATKELIKVLKLDVKVVNVCNWMGGHLLELLNKEKDYKKKLLTLMIQGVDKEMTKDKLKCLKKGVKAADVIVMVGEKSVSYLKKPDVDDEAAKVINSEVKKIKTISPALDYDIFSPDKDKVVEYPYSLDTLKERPKNKAFLQRTSGFKVSKDVMLVGVVTSMSAGVGGELLVEVAPGLMDMGIQLVVLTNGDKDRVKELKKIAKDYPKQMAVMEGFDEKMARKIYAGSDVTLIPAKRGYTVQGAMKALCYGSVPIVRGVGAYGDVLQDYNPNREQGNSFMFQDSTKWQLFAAVVRALEVLRFPYDWASIVESGMESRFFYHETAKQCVDIYRDGLRKKLGIEEEEVEG